MQWPPDAMPLLSYKSFWGLGHQRSNFDSFIYIHYAAPPYSAGIRDITSVRLSKFEFRSKGAGQFEAKFQVERLLFLRISMDLQIAEWPFYNVAAESFHTKKLCSRLYSIEVDFYSKIRRKKSLFEPHFRGLQSINQSLNFQSDLSSDATARTTMGVTVKKCHRIMSRNDCWNRMCFSCC